MKKEHLIIHTDVGTLLEMFEILKELPPEMDTEDTRIKILYMLGQNGSKVSMFKTKRTKKQIIKDCQKRYGQIADLTSYQEDESERLNGD